MEESNITFASLGLSDAMLKALEKKGYGYPTTIQAEAIPYFLQWRDVIAKAPTGTGKTFAFGIPMIEHIDAESEEVQGLILAPTRELAIQIGDELRGLLTYFHNIRVAVLYGGAGIGGQTKGQDYFFGGVRDIFEADDMTLINLECVLSDATERVEKRWNLKGKPEYIGIMTGSSIEACSLGNNHTYDYGQAGLDDTRNVLENAGIVYGFNDHTGIYETADGTRIGIVSVSLLSQNGDREAYIQNGIAQLREQGAAIVIACCHWGIEGDHYPNDYQQAAAHRIIDWGADLVVGNHPHVLQGMEVYNGKMICYSLGNFCFGGNKNPADKNTAIYQQTFTLINGELQPGIDAQIIPCTLSSVSSYNDFRPTVASGEKAQEICNLMNTYSQNCSNIEIDGLGKLHVN